MISGFTQWLMIQRLLQRPGHQEQEGVLWELAAGEEYPLVERPFDPGDVGEEKGTQGIAVFVQALYDMPAVVRHQELLAPRGNP